jgi:hypothetical protein
MTPNDRKRPSPVEAAAAVGRLGEFLARYGELMTPAELTKVFRYPSARAFRRAIQNGAFPVPVVQVPGRRGRFALTRDVVSWLEDLKRG